MWRYKRTGRYDLIVGASSRQENDVPRGRLRRKGTTTGYLELGDAVEVGDELEVCSHFCVLESPGLARSHSAVVHCIFNSVAATCRRTTGTPPVSECG